MRQNRTSSDGEMSDRIEYQRPVERKSPDIGRVVEIVRLLVMRWQRVVQRGKFGYMVVDRDPVIGHGGGAAAGAAAARL